MVYWNQSHKTKIFVKSNSCEVVKEDLNLMKSNSEEVFKEKNNNEFLILHYDEII